MTLSTLTMVTAFLLAGVSILSASLLSVALLYTSRRLQTPEKLGAQLSELAGQLSLLRKEHRNLDEIFESYRKRDAQRTSSATQRAKKAEEQSAETAFDADAFRKTGVM